MSSKCDDDVFKNGQSVCLVDIPKEVAENICRGLSAVTGCKIDWYYAGGWVHIKAIPPATQNSHHVTPLHPHNDGLDEYRQPVHVGELDPAQRLSLARGEKWEE